MRALRRALALVLVALAFASAAPAQPVSADPKTVEVRTVPPLAGVKIELDGQTIETGVDGTASFETEDFRDAGERLVVVDERVELESGDGYYQHARTFGKSVDLALAFDLYREVSFRFVTLQGRELTVDEIDSLQLKNSLGGRFEDVDRTAPVVVHANRVVSSPSGPVVRDIVWSIDSVMVGSSNVVNRSEVRFTPATENEIVVTTLFFDAQFTVGDLFFGFPTGDALLVEDPNGLVTSYPLLDGTLFLDDLPRGDYRVTVVGQGLKLSRPVALSRNQEVDLALLSYLDLVVAAVGLVVFATGTVITGLRRRRRRRRRRLVRAAAAEAGVSAGRRSPPAVLAASARRLTDWRQFGDSCDIVDLADLVSEADSDKERSTSTIPATKWRGWTESAQEAIEDLWPGAVDPDAQPWEGWQTVGRRLTRVLRLRSRDIADSEPVLDLRGCDRRRPVRTSEPLGERHATEKAPDCPVDEASTPSPVLLSRLIAQSRSVVDGYRRRRVDALGRYGERLRSRSAVAAGLLWYLDEIRNAADQLGRDPAGRDIGGADPLEPARATAGVSGEAS